MRHDIYNTGAIGGLLAPATTELATIAAKCMGLTSATATKGKSKGAITTVNDTSSITITTKTKNRFTNSKMAMELCTQLVTAVVRYWGTTSVNHMWQINTT